MQHFDLEYLDLFYICESLMSMADNTPIAGFSTSQGGKP